MSEGDTLANALLGAVASIVLFFLPFSPLLGGLLAGYLEGGARGDGLRVGALAGAIVVVPLLLFVLLVGGVGSLFFLGGVPHAIGAAGAIGWLLLVFLVGAVAAYTVGLSALGGWLGNYVKGDTELGG